jgi:YidC/Oxa1 family membrane protein insertase
MKFYQENKVNPFGSCLPLVMQLPVFFSLFYMLRKDLKIDICGPKEHILSVAAEHGKTLTTIGCDQVDPGSAGFLFINDLTAKATGATLIILIVLYVGSQLLSSVLMSVTADRNQRFIMIALPFVFVPFIQGFPAGLLVYWITTNLWTVGQQYIIRRGAGLPVLGAPGSNMPSPAPGVVSDKDRERSKKDKDKDKDKDKAKPSANGGDGAGSAPEREQHERRASAPPPPPRQRRKKKTGRRR